MLACQNDLLAAEPLQQNSTKVLILVPYSSLLQTVATWGKKKGSHIYMKLAMPCRLRRPLYVT